MPGFTKWMDTQKNDPDLGAMVHLALDGEASDGILNSLAAQYLLAAKRKDGKPLDPVARFHLGNGARLHRIHGGADRRW